MKINNFYLSRILYFICIYIVLLLRDVFAMLYIYVKNNVLYWDNVAFKEAFVASLIFFIPVVVIQFILYKYGY